MDLASEMEKRGLSILAQDNVAQNFLLKEHWTGTLSFAELCQEFDRLEFYERACLGTLWPCGLWIWLKHCVTDQTITSFQECVSSVKQKLPPSIRLDYDGRVVSVINNVYKGCVVMNREQYRCARTLALNESFSTSKGLEGIMTAAAKESKQYRVVLPLLDELRDIVCAHSAEDCLAYLRLHLPENIALEESLLWFGVEQPWDFLVPESVHGVSHPARCYFL
jgi:hypothetical protein